MNQLNTLNSVGTLPMVKKHQGKIQDPAVIYSNYNISEYESFRRAINSNS